MTTATLDPVPLCAALGDETRWRILQLLGDADRSASELAGLLPVTRQAVAKHLGQLEAVGLVQARREGRSVRYRALGGPLSRLASQLDVIGQAWEARLDLLARVAEGLADE